MFGGALGNAINRWLSAKADIPMLFIFLLLSDGSHILYAPAN